MATHKTAALPVAVHRTTKTHPENSAISPHMICYLVIEQGQHQRIVKNITIKIL